MGRVVSLKDPIARKEYHRTYGESYYVKNKEHIRVQSRLRYLKNRDRILDRGRARREEKCKSRPLRVYKTRRDISRDYRKKCLEQGLCPYCGQPQVPGLKICATHRQAQLDMNYAYRVKLRRDVFDAYGGKCACCGEPNYLFLTMDHPNNDGAAHRKQTGCGTGIKFYQWLRKNGYPKEFQPLCWNCNCGKRDNGGVCPHQEVREKVA